MLEKKVLRRVTLKYYAFIFEFLKELFSFKQYQWLFANYLESLKDFFFIYIKNVILIISEGWKMIHWFKQKFIFKFDHKDMQNLIICM